MNCPHCGHNLQASYPTLVHVGDNPLAYIVPMNAGAAACNPSLYSAVGLGGNNAAACNPFSGGVAIQGQSNLVFSVNAQPNTK